MPAAKHFFKRFAGDIWIETGTYLGAGVLEAIEADYEQIISIELSNTYATAAKQRFEDKHNVSIINGSSHEVLPKVLSSLRNEKIVFWLDAHYSACGTAGEDDPNPLMKELEVIRAWKKNNDATSPIILIDDMRTFTYDNCNFSEKEIVNCIMEIDQNYKVQRENGLDETILNDVLIATIG